MPRTSPIADAASRMPAPCSSADSSAVAGVAATWVVGMRSAASVAARYTTTATTSTPSDSAMA